MRIDSDRYVLLPNCLLTTSQGCGTRVISLSRHSLFYFSLPRFFENRRSTPEEAKRPPSKDPSPHHPLKIPAPSSPPTKASSEEPQRPRTRRRLRHSRHSTLNLPSPPHFNLHNAHRPPRSLFHPITKPISPPSKNRPLKNNPPRPQLVPLHPRTHLHHQTRSSSHSRLHV